MSISIRALGVPAECARCAQTQPNVRKCGSLSIIF